MIGRVPGIATLFVLAACGSDAGGAVDVALRTEQGPFVGTLTIDPNPPHVGEHRVVIMLDESADPLEGAAVMLSPWMPAHGHGSTDVDAVEREPGVYVAEHVWLNMPGIWDLRVRVDGEEPGALIATVEVP